ncbi:MAG: hypothetical protein ABIT38_07050 [Gemmatimonadaceae bacterium]
MIDERERIAGANMVRRFLKAFVILIALASASRAEAQFGRRDSGGSGGAKWWLSAWGGYQWGDRVTDPKTNADWLFDQNWSTRLTIEREVAPGVTAGVAYNYSRMPLRFQSLDATGSCLPSCKGDATLASYGLTIRSGMGGRDRSFHFVSEGFLGAIQYGHFALAGNSPTAIAARDISNTDFAYSIGLGFGYTLTREWEWVAMFETLNGIHERSEELFGQRNSRHYSLRTGVRFGLF